ncbi:dsRBD fold-containing protein [Actinoplanes sp. NPDC049599]|uniref:dsRBD fold-containing protein n=1 Tax=Actinoplanes sp. NPDC049599 TaxID=3363903 RepID=UPI003788220C
MVRTRTWTVEIRIIEHEDDGRTRRETTLRWQPSDQEAAKLSDEPATARALADLAYKALDVATGDLEQFTHRHRRMLS